MKVSVYEEIGRDRKGTVMMGFVTRDETAEEVADRVAIEKATFYNNVYGNSSVDEKVRLLIESIPTTEKPQNRPGFVWKQIYDATEKCFGWEEIPDPFYVPTADGTYVNPFEFVEGMTVESGKWYKFSDGNIWECIKTGDGSLYTAEWFDII